MWTVAKTASASEAAKPNATAMKIRMNGRLLEYSAIDSSVAFPSLS
jgi:hypothetical protein